MVRACYLSVAHAEKSQARQTRAQRTRHMLGSACLCLPACLVPRIFPQKVDPEMFLECDCYVKIHSAGTTSEKSCRTLRRRSSITACTTGSKYSNTTGPVHIRRVILLLDNLQCRFLPQDFTQFCFCCWTRFKRASLSLDTAVIIIFILRRMEGEKFLNAQITPCS